MRPPRLVVGVVALALVGGACSSDSNRGEANNSGDQEQTKVKVALILPNAINDFGWNQQAFEGAKALEAQGLIDLAYSDNVGQDAGSFAPVAEQYAQQGYELIIAHSFDYGEPVLRLAKKYPDVNWAWSGSALPEDTASNVADYAQNWYQGAYLAGILMAGATKTGTIGGIGGFDIPTCHAQYEAMIAGAKLQNPGIKSKISYLGTWFDPAKEKEAALAQYDSGVDIISTCGVQIGIVEAAKERNLGVVGQIYDQTAAAPTNVLTTIVLNTEVLWKAMVDDIAKGTFNPGKIYNLGVADDVITVIPNDQYSGALSQDVLDLYDDTLAGMKDGSIEAPFIPS